MLQWKKKGRICSHETFDLPWYRKNTMVPVPYQLDAKRLRIFITMCDAENIGRIGYVDVDADDPSQLIGYSAQPVLDIGTDGHFDDSGVLPSALIEQGGRLYMFYSAYQKQAKVPYSILSGMAAFNADFSQLHRVQASPILERTDEEQFIRSAIFCDKTDTGYRLYYSSGTSWTHNGVKQAPRYDIKCIESADLFDWHGAKPHSSIRLQGDEYGLTTPGVYREGGMFKMIYAIRSISKGYRIGYAESHDGLDWTRMDTQMQIDVSVDGWDSEMICFANRAQVNGKTYLFYCGNHYGMGGMGYAELIET